MTISTIIATYNRAPLLDECLARLAGQHFAAGDEVIIVDNGSTDRTPAVIEQHRGCFPVALHHLFEPHPGKSHALRAALTAATGDSFAFIDDDVLVDPEWLEAIRDLLGGDSHIALVGGPVLPRWEREAPRWLRFSGERYGRLAAPLALLNYGPDRLDLGARTLLGANLAVTRQAIEAVGGFALHLGKLRGTLLSGEDHDLCARIQAAGFRGAYDPRPIVRHWVPADRVRIRYLLHWFYWSGITNAILDEDQQTTGRSMLGIPFYVARRFVVSALAALAAIAGGRTDRAAEHVIECAFDVGYAARRLGLVALPAPNRSAATETT